MHTQFTMRTMWYSLSTQFQSLNTQLSVFFFCALLFLLTFFHCIDSMVRTNRFVIAVAHAREKTSQVLWNAISFVYFSFVTSKNCNDVTDCISIWWRCELMERVTHTHSQCAEKCERPNVSERARVYRISCAYCKMPPKVFAMESKETGGNILSSMDLYCHILNGRAYATYYTSHSSCAKCTHTHRLHCKCSCTYFSIKASKAKLSKMCNRQPNNGAWNKAEQSVEAGRDRTR